MNLLDPVWLASVATPKLPIGAVPEYFVPGITGGRVRSIPVSWLPSAIGDEVLRILKERQ